MFNNIFIFVFAMVIITIPLVFIQREIKEKHQRYIMVLPALCIMVSIYKSVPNFVKAFDIQFSIGAFMASLLFLLILNIPTMSLLLLSGKRIH